MYMLNYLPQFVIILCTITNINLWITKLHITFLNIAFKRKSKSSMTKICSQFCSSRRGKNWKLWQWCSDFWRRVFLMCSFFLGDKAFAPEASRLYWFCGAVQSQKAVTAYFSSKQLLPFGFAGQNGGHAHLTVDYTSLLTRRPQLGMRTQIRSRDDQIKEIPAYYVCSKRSSPGSLSPSLWSLFLGEGCWWQWQKWPARVSCYLIPVNSNPTSTFLFLCVSAEILVDGKMFRPIKRRDVSS